MYTIYKQVDYIGQVLPVLICRYTVIKLLVIFYNFIAILEILRLLKNIQLMRLKSTSNRQTTHCKSAGLSADNLNIDNLIC